MACQLTAGAGVVEIMRYPFLWIIYLFFDLLIPCLGQVINVDNALFEVQRLLQLDGMMSYIPQWKDDVSQVAIMLDGIKGLVKIPGLDGVLNDIQRLLHLQTLLENLHNCGKIETLEGLLRKNQNGVDLSDPNNIETLSQLESSLVDVRNCEILRNLTSLDLKFHNLHKLGDILKKVSVFSTILGSVRGRFFRNLRKILDDAGQWSRQISNIEDVLPEIHSCGKLSHLDILLNEVRFFGMKHLNFNLLNPLEVPNVPFVHQSYNLELFLETYQEFFKQFPCQFSSISSIDISIYSLISSDDLNFRQFLEKKMIFHEIAHGRTVSAPLSDSSSSSSIDIGRAILTTTIDSEESTRVLLIIPWTKVVPSDTCWKSEEDVLSGLSPKGSERAEMESLFVILAGINRPLIDLLHKLKIGTHPERLDFKEMPSEGFGSYYQISIPLVMPEWCKDCNLKN